MAITISGQIKALIHRNFLLQSKQIKTNVFQILFPMLCMIVIIALNSAVKNWKAQQAAFNNGGNSDSSNNDSSMDYNGSNYYEKGGFQIYQEIIPLGTTVGYYWFVNPTSPSSLPVGNSSMHQNEGLLSNLPETYFFINNTQVMFPIFQMEPNSQSVDTDIVAFFNRYINSVKQSYFYNSQNLTFCPPSAAIYFTEYEPNTKQFQYTLENFAYPLSSGPFSSYLFTSNNYDTTWQLSSWLNNAFLKTIMGDSYGIDSTMSSITLSVQVDLDIVTYLVGIFVLPNLFTFIFPVFVHSLVFEKQEKLFQVMAMMGLKNLTYIVSNQIYFIILYIIIMVVICLMSFAAQLIYFTSEPFKMLLLIIVYGLSLVSLAFFFSAFFWKAKTSAIISYLLVLIAPQIGSNIALFAFKGRPAPLPFLFFPPFAFAQGLNLIFIKLNGQGHFDNVLTFSPYSQFSQVIMALIMETIVFFILGLYLSNVLPKEFGGSLSPFYPIYSIIDYFNLKKTTKEPYNEKSSLLGSINVGVYDDTDIIEEDIDCRKEREKANSGESYLLKAMNVKKVYKTGSNVKEALVNFCLTSTAGEVIGLLGPNGAGKSTFIHITSGVSKPTNGDVLINGLSISTQMDKIYETLGFCSQHDILMEDLSIIQHLEFYCNLKGLFDSKSQRDRHIEELLKNVNLYQDKHKKISQLSGGMRRRVSISISILGDNKLVLLDEPTTGLDLEAKRLVWDIIDKVKHNKTILITTHDMEEADALCSKICIVTNGRLQCIGDPVYLKNKYGNGFKLDIVPVGESYKNQIVNFISQTFPNAVQQESLNTNLSFVIPKNNNISVLFDTISQNKLQLGISDWGISETSLEEVFIKLAALED